MDEYEARAFNVLHIHPVPVVLHRLALTICETKKAPRVWDAFFVNAIFRCPSQESNPEPTDPKLRPLLSRAYLVVFLGYFIHNTGKKMSLVCNKFILFNTVATR